MSRDRGLRLQNALAAYLTRWWPHAESAGSGRPGSDVLGTPGIVWENKAAARFSPAEFCRQARTHTAAFALDQPVDWPIAVYWPPGVGERNVENTISMMPTGLMVQLLREAGYGLSDHELDMKHAAEAEEAFSALALDGMRKFKEAR